MLFVAAELNKSDISRNVEGWLELRKKQLKRANINLGYARTAMLKAPRAAEFAVGDMVIVSERVLPLRAASAQSEKLQQRYLGPC